MAAASWLPRAALADDWGMYVAVQESGAVSGRACTTLSSPPIAFFVARPAGTSAALRLPGEAWAAVQSVAPHRYRVSFHDKVIGSVEQVGDGWRAVLDGGDTDCTLHGRAFALIATDERAPTDATIRASLALEASIGDALMARSSGRPRAALDALSGIEVAADALPSVRKRAYLHRARIAAEIREFETAASAAARARTLQIPLGLDQPLVDAFGRSQALRVPAIREDQERAVATREALESAVAPYADLVSEDRLANRVYLSTLQIALRRFDDADATLADVLTQVAKAFPPTDPVRVEAVIARARIDRERGDYRGAKARVFDLLQEVAETAGTANLAYAQLATAYAQNAAVANRPFEAIPALNRSVAWFVAELGRDNLYTLSARESLAYTFAFAERLSEAIAIQREVVATYAGMRSTPVERINAGHILANLFGRDRRYAEAHALLTSLVAEAERETTRGDMIAHLKLDLAYVLWQTRGPVPACLRVREVQASVQVGLALPVSLASELDLLAAMCTARASPDEGIAGLRTVVALRTALYGKDSLSVLRAQAALGRAQIDAGDLRSARTTLSELAASVESLRRIESPDALGARNAFAEWLVSDALYAGYRDLALLEAQLGEPARAIRIAESARARSLNDAIGLRRDIAGLPTREQYRAEALVASVRARDAEIALMAPSDPARYALEVARTDSTQELSALTRASALGDTAPALLDLDRAGNAIPPGAAFVGYQVVRGGVWAFVVRRDRAPVVIVLKGALPLVGALESIKTALSTSPTARAPVWRTADGKYVNALTRPTPESQPVDVDDMLRLLGDVLVEPLLPALSAKQELILAADGMLAGMPLEAMWVEGARAGSRWRMQYAPSLSVWSARAGSRTRRGDALRRDLVAIGAPDYAAMTEATLGPLAARPWAPLPGAVGELAAIAASFPASRRAVVAGDEATKARFVSMARDGTLANTRYLHIAAHGLLSADAPQWSSIVLGGIDGAPGYVTAAELATFDVGADLVVLSACETALGKDVAGEGLFGLPYALAVAGARATLLTLWPVADRPTAEFMRRFYAKLARGVAPVAALAQTKREFIRSKEFSAPFYWAPFVLYGT